MLYPKLTVMLVAFAVALAELAVVPHGVVSHILSSPSYVRDYVYWHRLRTEVDRLAERAERHDPKAQFEVAGWMEFGLYGARSDPRQYRKLIHEAADRGYVPARIRMWELDGGTAQDLYELIPEEWDLQWSRVVNWREVAMRECHAPLYIRDRMVSDKYRLHYRDRYKDLDRTIGAQINRDRWPIAEAQFVQACGFSLWPAG